MLRSTLVCLDKFHMLVVLDDYIYKFDFLVYCRGRDVILSQWKFYAPCDYS